MFQAEIHLQQEKYCVLAELADRFDASFDVAIEEHHDHEVTFVIELADPSDEHVRFLEHSEQVRHIEPLEEGKYIVTKRSCGGYSAIEQNHAILRRQTHITANRRVYTVLLFRREDLKAIVEEFRRIGTVTVGKFTQFQEPSHRLTDRQREVVETALELGYFEWPRDVKSEELAAELGVGRSTLLEHLRKAESKLLTAALEGGSEVDRTGYAEPARES